MSATSSNNPFAATAAPACLSISASSPDLALTHFCLAAESLGADPVLGSAVPDAPLYLPATSPRGQRRLVAECEHASPIAVDTARRWVKAERSAVLSAMREATIAFMDTGEALALTGLARWFPAGHYLRELGIPIVVMKHGEYGASLFAEGCYVQVPAYPIEVDARPGGAGDAFAGGFLGTIARVGSDLGREALAAAMIAGSVTASFAVEGDGAGRLSGVSAELLSSRFDELVAMTSIPV